MVVTKNSGSLIIRDSNSRQITGSIKIEEGETWNVSGDDVCVTKKNGSTYVYDDKGRFKNSFR